ncbi:MAG: discoidin domain-containing protein, partial [Planctomycetes bacterium]|nr:discoidin domain-containing protein [Planctomycetota bacterium]
GLKGSTDHHENWLGFEGTDMEAVIDLGSVQEIRSIQADFMQAIQFWIFLPREVDYALSMDGLEYESVAKRTPALPIHATGIVIEPFEAAFELQKARFIRIRAQGIKTCPDWHIGAGGKAWIFTDEVVIQ